VRKEKTPQALANSAIASLNARSKSRYEAKNEDWYQSAYSRFAISLKGRSSEPIIFDPARTGKIKQ
jgi:hypothetical protein